MVKVTDIAIGGIPQSKYSKDYACPNCNTYYSDYDDIDVTYYKLPHADTIAGIIPKDGAVEVRCTCGTTWWCHIDIENRDVHDNETIVKHSEIPDKIDGRKRGTYNQDKCDFDECKFCMSNKCCFGGWNAGLGCYMDMDEGEFDNIVQTIIGSRIVRSAIKYAEDEESE